MSIVCPFCFEQIKTSEIEYRCTNTWCPSANEPDEKWAAYMGIEKNQATAGHVVKKPKSLFSFGSSKPVMCDSCKQATLRICPHCHNTLPDSTITGSDNIISIIGTRSSGKSVYIGVLINEMLKRVAPSFKGSMSGFTDLSGLYDANKYYRNTKYNSLYEKREILAQTESHTGNRSIQEDKMPLVYKFAYVTNARGRKDDFTLAFFDAAGEDQEDPRMAATVMRYIAHSKGIIFLMDPLQIPDVLDEVEAKLGHKSTSTGTGDGESSTEPNIVLANLTALIRQSLGMTDATKKIEIPVAIAFSKFDAIQSLVPNELTLQQPSPHCSMGAFVDTDAQNVNAEMRSLLTTWGQQSMITAIETDYSKFAFFSLSSLGLGNEPAVDRSIKKPHPHRVEDPMLWLMAQNKLVSFLKQ